MTTTATEVLIAGKASVLELDFMHGSPSRAEEMERMLSVSKRNRLTVLMADDDFDDCLLAREAWEELKTDHLLRFVHDGQELLDYVYHEGHHQDPRTSPSPALILLDLNMPKKSGMEVVRVLKGDLQLQTIPIIVFSTTKNIDHIIQTYKNGANAFMSKPTSYEGYVNALKSIEVFWLTFAEIPLL